MLYRAMGESFIFAAKQASMLQIAVIRQNPEGVKERLNHRNFAEIDLVDQILDIDEKRRALQAELDQLQSYINAASKEIGQLMSSGKKQEAEEHKQKVAAWKLQQAPMQDQLKDAEAAQEQLLLKLPNLPHHTVPAGKEAADNEVVRSAGTLPSLPEGAVPHWDLIKQYDLVNFEAGAKITGSGFALYKGMGAKLQRALITYFLDFNTAAGYTEYLPPHLVNAETAYGTGQLPDKEGQMYHVTEDGFYLIPTAEVPVTNIYRDTILKEQELPVMMTAYTPCFRREAGSFGKDVRGLNRVHQFDKVELVQLVHPEKSYAVLEEMVAHVEKLLQSLELPYRILRLCGGDMGFTSALTYDFEVYSAAQDKWLEVSSVSNFETFQTNRMKIRFKDADGKTKLLHSLNGSSLALPRIMACLLENNQSSAGIKIPTVLLPYLGTAVIK